jgi:hypothetical protein
MSRFHSFGFVAKQNSDVKGKLADARSLRSPLTSEFCFAWLSRMEARIKIKNKNNKIGDKR